MVKNITFEVFYYVNVQRTSISLCPTGKVIDVASCCCNIEPLETW